MPKRAIFDKKNILVLGGAGFIGSHLCDELVKNNKVICLDNFLTGDEANIAHLLQNPDFKFVRHDIVEPLDLEKMSELEPFRVSFQGLQEIYFLASPTSPKAYSKYPIETMLVNAVGLRNALDLAVKYKSQFLYASSPAVYGEVDIHKPISENHLGVVNHLIEDSCYAEAKRFGEGLVSHYRRQHKLDTKIVRIFNCYGPRMKLDDGRMIPEMIRLALENKTLVVYGDQNSVGSYFYVSDLIKALVMMMESNENGPINLSSEWKTSFKEVAEKIIEILGASSDIKYQSDSVKFSSQLLADINLAKEKLGWFPIILLDEGLKKTIDDLSAQKGILRPSQLV